MLKKLLLFLLIICLSIIPCYGKTPWTSKPPIGSQIDWSHPLSRGLVGCWLMNEGGGSFVQDLALNNKGVLSSPVWIPQGLNFDGSDDVISPIKATSFPAGSGFTIVFWICPADTSIERWFLDRQTATNQLIQLYSNNLDGSKITIRVRDDAGNGLTSVLSNAGVLAINTWAHLVFVRNRSAGTMNIYKNGLLVGSGADYNWGTITPTFRIGCEVGQSTNGWYGKANIFMVYNRALSPSEIQQLYQEPYCFIMPQTAWEKVTAAGTSILQSIINTF